MLDLHYWHTPNGQKITLFLEEAGLPYRIVPVDITRGDQHQDAFLKISPNGRMPAIVDDEPADGGAPISVFESGAILVYLARKTGKFLPHSPREEARVMQWLMWQMGGVGPMFGQAGHFLVYADQKVDHTYAKERYSREVARLAHVLEGELDRSGNYVCGDLSIADMAIFPWMRLLNRYSESTLAKLSHVAAWLDRMSARPAVTKALATGKDFAKKPEDMDDAARKILFSHDKM